jgi:hypothetical protein
MIKNFAAKVGIITEYLLIRKIPELSFGQAIPIPGFREVHQIPQNWL